MKRMMKIIELPPIEDNQSIVTIELKIKRPGLIRQTSVMVKPTNIGVIMQATGRKPQMELVPVIVCEIDPDLADQEPEDRKFYVVPPGITVESEIWGLEYRGSFLYPQGIILFLFEEI
jgi:hypothetical protein